jgi:DNA-binding MarR family transcriptional regulator
VRAHIIKPSMVYLVNHLEAHGDVERTADPVAGRAQRVRITERGMETIRCVRRLVTWWTLVIECSFVAIKGRRIATVPCIRVF